MKDHKNNGHQDIANNEHSHSNENNGKNKYFGNNNKKECLNCEKCHCNGACDCGCENCHCNEDNESNDDVCCG